MNHKQYYSANKNWWEKMVKEKCGFTKPWLNIDVRTLQKLAKGELRKPPEPLNDIYPLSILANIKGKDVLCLASGGGQQSVVFGLLGSNVTVVDIADGQLVGDKEAASHYGYKVRTIQGDMSNLSMIKNRSFDLVYQAPSMGYIPNIGKVYSEVARILKRGGLYRADAQNPQSQFVDESSWDGVGYRISVPYAIKKQQRAKDKRVFEYRHYLDETFNGLIENGFIVEKVEEMPDELYRSKKDKPGSWGHLLSFIPGLFAILARKK